MEDTNLIFPSSMLFGELTLEEIGAILVLLYSGKIADFSVWENDEDFKRVLKNLKDSNIVKIENEQAEIDLTWIKI